MADSIISLCYVNNIRDKTVFLNRIADFRDGRFEEYQSGVNSGLGEDFIIGFTSRINSDLGSLGVYQWYVYQDGDKPKTEVHPISVSWTEVIFSNYASPNEIINTIKRGWRTSSAIDQRNLIICCRESGRFYTDTLTGVFIPADALRYDGTSYSFTENIIHVEIGNVYSEALLQYRNHYILPSPDNWKMTGYESIRSIDEILDSVMGNLISKIDKVALSRKERQAARSALSKISDDTIIKAVAERINCSEKEAIEYVSDYLKSRKYKLDNDQILDFIGILVECDADAVQELRKQVEIEWKQENAALVAEEEQNIDAAKTALQGIVNETTSIQTELDTLYKKKAEIESQIEEASQLRSEVESEITRLLEDIRTLKAETIVKGTFLDAAITQHMGAHQTTTIPVASRNQVGYNIRFKAVNSQVQDDSITENYAVAVESIEKYCITDVGQRELVLFLFATYACRQHLIMVGETAEDLALMYASSITGYHCPVIFLHEDADIASAASELEKLPHSIVAVRESNTACYEQLRELMRLLPETQFIRLMNHEESLLMEPESLYTTFIPILTDMFCQSTEISIPDGFDCSKALMAENLKSIPQKELNAEKTKWQKWLGNVIHSPLLEHRCAQIQILMQRLTKSTENSMREASLAGMVFLFTPLMKCLKYTDTISERLRMDSSITSQTKAIIKSYCGIEDD